MFLRIGLGILVPGITLALFFSNQIGIGLPPFHVSEAKNAEKLEKLPVQACKKAGKGVLL